MLLGLILIRHEGNFASCRPLEIGPDDSLFAGVSKLQAYLSSHQSSPRTSKTLQLTQEISLQKMSTARRGTVYQVTRNLCVGTALEAVTLLL
jgi:hypothetical protein